jgi:3-methyladenine DNA glycosylase AlkD
MEENEKLLVLTICKLLDRTPNAKNVEDAYQWALRQIEKGNRPRTTSQPDGEDWR